jgi:hypothetical protein
MNIDKIHSLDAELLQDLTALKEIETRIYNTLQKYADSKILKGNERVGWLGEIYCKLLLDGSLVPDNNEHDVITKEGHRISVKTRKSISSSWNISSLIPAIDGDKCPTHLLFVLLNDNYHAERMWLFDWGYLHATNRFKPKSVIKNNRGWYLRIKPSIDSPFIIYDNGCIKKEHPFLTRQLGS